METSERPEFLPYLSEYAKTGRSSCKGCKANIPQGTLRLAVVFKVFSIVGVFSWIWNADGLPSFTSHQSLMGK